MEFRTPKISPLPPSHLLDVEYTDGDEGQFGTAHSPSELNVKYQEEDKDYDDEDQYYQQYPVPHTPYHQFRYFEQPRQQPAQLPSTLIVDLKNMLAVYKRRFSPQEDSVAVPPPPAAPLTPPPPATPRLTPRPILPLPPREDPTTSEEEPEEGEIHDPPPPRMNGTII